VHNALALFMGYYVAKGFKLNKTDRKTVSIETGIQNSGLALALLFNTAIFPADLPIGGMAFIAAWWGVWHILSGLTIASIWSGFSIVPKSYVEV
jgi:BASS family bile acid:Na+ symporter